MSPQANMHVKGQKHESPQGYHSWNACIVPVLVHPSTVVDLYLSYVHSFVPGGLKVDLNNLVS